MPRRMKDDFKALALTRAYIATHAYAKYENDILPVDGWEQVCKSKDLIGESLNGFQGALYRREDPVTKERKYIIAFCGFDEPSDIKNVLAAGFLGLPGQLEDAYAFTTKACAEHKIPSADLEFAGHSLGGYLAKSVAAHWGAKAVWSFNSPGFKSEDEALLKVFFTEKPCASDKCVKTSLLASTHNINSKYDVVSRWGYQPGHIYEVDTPGDHHNMRVMIESMSGMCLLSKQANAPGKLRLAARQVFDNIGRSLTFRNSLDGIFRKKNKKPPQKKP